MSQYEKYFAPQGYYVWDSWFHQDHDGVHAFYLRSKRDGDPDGRHHNRVCIGHALSQDMIQWKDLGVALEPGDEGDFDGLSLWTGDLFKHQDKYYLFYTGRRKEEFWTQRIGLAVSEDLTTFHKVPDIILEADPTYYEHFDGLNAINMPGAWRDPNLFYDKHSRRFIMTISARERHTGNEFGVYNACIGMASSKDLFNWEIQPPLLSPGIYDQMECPQLLFYSGWYYLFFSAWAETTHPDFHGERSSGLFAYASRDLHGPWEPVNGNGVVLSNGHRIYDVRLVTFQGSKFMSLGWLNESEDGEFIGRLSHPIPFELNGTSVVPSYFS